MASHDDHDDRADRQLAGRWRDVSGRGPVAEVAVLVEGWGERYSPSTRQRFAMLVSRYARRLEATGVASIATATVADCEGFCWAPTRRNQAPAPHTVHLRRSAIRALYATARRADPSAADPADEVELPSRRQRRVRALTDAEINLVRTAALGRVRYRDRAVAAVALAEATATTGELAVLCWADLDLDAGRARLPGAVPVRARTGTLTDWGTAVLSAQRDRSQPDPRAWLIGRRADTEAVQAAVTNLVAKVLTAAGLADPAVKPASIRLWAAQRHLRAVGIEAAANALGIDSLDAAAAALDHRWQDQP